MGIRATGSRTFKIGGLTMSGGDNLLTDKGIEANPTPEIGPAKAGTLTTRTDANTGTLTMSGGHGITTGQRLDLYWAVAGVRGYRRGITVGTVATNSVPIDLGAGDDLPPAATAITAMVPHVETVTVTGDNINGIAFSSSVGPFQVTLTAADGTTEQFTRRYDTNNAYGWVKGNGETNPLAGVTLGKVYYSHGDTTDTGDFKFGVAGDSF